MHQVLAGKRSCSKNGTNPAPVARWVIPSQSHHAVFHRNPNSYPAWCRISQPSTSMLDYPIVGKTVINHPVITIFFWVLCLPSPSHGCVYGIVLPCFTHWKSKWSPTFHAASCCCKPRVDTLELLVAEGQQHWAGGLEMIFHSNTNRCFKRKKWRLHRDFTRKNIGFTRKNQGFTVFYQAEMQVGLMVWPYLEVGCLETLKKMTKRSKDHGDSLKACWQYKKLNIKHY